eukprot:31244-Pelagococcus_subviridis.AAC.2
MVLSTARARGSRATKCFSRPHLGEKRIILPRLDDSKTTGYFSNYAPSDGNASPRRMFRMTVRVLRSIRFRNCHVVRIETRFGVRGWDAVQIFPQKSQRNPLALTKGARCVTTREKIFTLVRDEDADTSRTP